MARVRKIWRNLDPPTDLIKNVELGEKKKLIRYQMIKKTEETFKKYKFEDFDTAAFLSDFKDVVETIEW